APAPSIVKWLGAYIPYAPKAMKYIPDLFSLLSLGCMAGYLFGLLPGLPVALMFFLGLLISGAFFKTPTTLAADTNRLQNTFQQYQKLILKIDGVNFSANFLQDKMEGLISREQKASKVFKAFSDILAALDQRNN